MMSSGARVHPVTSCFYKTFADTSKLSRTIAFQGFGKEEMKQVILTKNSHRSHSTERTRRIPTTPRNVLSNRFVLGLMTLVLFVSGTAIVLTLLVILGKIGDIDSHGSGAKQHKAPKGQQLRSSTPLEDKIKELRGNITMIETFMKKLQRNLHSTKSDLNDTKNNIRGTNDKLSQLETGTEGSINKISYISQILDASLRAVNSSFYTELSSAKTAFDAKLNNTAQNLSDADNSLQSTLNMTKNSLIEQIRLISKSQGPTGAPGFNGSKGDQGVQGPQGPQGHAGAQGPQGERGIPGEPGRNGTDGVTGRKGDVGVPGNKGDTGTLGPQGPQGPQGHQGPPGAGNFSQCVYKRLSGNPASPSIAAVSTAVLTEPVGKKILGVTCSTNRAAEYNLSTVKSTSGASAEKITYTCKCRGESSLFRDGSNSMRCFLYYLECQLTT